MDEIRIEGLDIYAHHGVYPEETQNGQHFFLSVVLYADTRCGGLTDDLTKTTNYGEVCLFLTRFLQEHTWKLLEAAAEHAARAVLLHFPLVRALDLEIRKPEAPIPLPFESVSVKIHRGWHRAFVALGSNMGEKERYILSAVNALAAREDVRVKRLSTLIQTAPYGGVVQDDFLNGAVEIETLLSPYELLDVLHGLEQAAHRERKVHWGPRTLDLDILLYDELCLDRPDLIVPHIDMANRDFVLRPMAELAPGLVHPVLGKTMQQLLREWEARGC